MNHKLKRKWTAALRGGTYRQCVAYLSMMDGRKCALGILQDLMGTNELGCQYGYDDMQNVLGNIHFSKITDLNDIYGKTFPEIADWIEENVP